MTKNELGPHHGHHGARGNKYATEMAVEVCNEGAQKSSQDSEYGWCSGDVSTHYRK